MYLVAIHYPPGKAVETLQEFAQILGRTAYELRSRLTIPAGGPAVVALFAEHAQAQDTAAALQSCGFQTMLFSAQEAEPSSTQLEVRRFGLEQDSFWVESRQAERIEVTYQEVGLLLRGVSFSTSTQVETKTNKKFSMGRALMSGGLVRNKKVKTTKESTSHHDRGFLQLYVSGHPALVFLEDQLLWDSLGDAMQPSRSANFLTLCNELRQRCPSALYDDRFLRKAGQKQLLGQSLDPESHLHISTALLARALLS